MPIDPSIPLQARGVQLESPGNQLAMMNEALKYNEMNRSIDTQNKLRTLYSQGIDISTPEGFKQVASIDPATALKLKTDALQGQKLQGDISKTAVETNKLGLDIEQKKIDLARQKTADLAFNPSNENIIAHLQDGVKRGEVTSEQANAQWQQLSTMPPAKRAEYFTQLGMKVDERAKLVEQQRHNKATEGISAGHLDVARQGLTQGTIPAGYRKTAEGNLEAIPGGPTTTPLAPKELQVREAKYPAATTAVKTVEAKADKLAADLRTLQNHPGLDEITGVAGGRLPGFTSTGREAKALYDSIVARGGFQELAAMRAASPTGGALGNVSNQEGQQLKDAFAAISRVQDASSLRTQLKRAEEDVLGAKSRVREAYDMTYDYKAGTPSVTPASSGKADPLGIR